MHHVRLVGPSDGLERPAGGVLYRGQAQEGLEVGGMVAQDRKVLVACLLQLALVLVQPAEVVLCRDAARVILIGALEGTHLDGVAVRELRHVELA